MTDLPIIKKNSDLIWKVETDMPDAIIGLSRVLAEVTA